MVVTEKIEIYIPQEPDTKTRDAIVVTENRNIYTTRARHQDKRGYGGH